MVKGRLPDPAFWRGRRVFVTGHTGFKGGWLSLWLLRMGAIVQGYALAPPAAPSLFEVARVADGMGHTIGDIRDAAALARSVFDFAPDVIIHLAAQPLVLASYAQPVETYATNVMGTVHLLEAARRGGAAATMIVTSDKCYDNRDMIWGYREHDPMGGHDPYSNSKGCAELVTSAYASSFFGPEKRALGSGRAGNVIGGGDWAKDRLMTDLIAALLAGRRPVLRSPAAVRPWQHVLEPLSGYLVAIEHLVQSGQFGAAWNFGPDAAGEVTVGQVATRVCDLWGSGLTPVFEDAARGKEARLLALDSTKARIELGWRPRWSLDRALAATVTWFRDFERGADMRDVTLRQIDDYIATDMTSAARLQE
jgi:CDP-glucose 4,6-dehydratase